jgi:hypothetical protein
VHYLMQIQHGVFMNIKCVDYRNSVFYNADDRQHRDCFTLGPAPIIYGWLALVSITVCVNRRISVFFLTVS